MAKYNVAAVGHALTDVVGQVDEAFIKANGLTKGAMTLVDEATSQKLYDAMKKSARNIIRVSGGSAGNTVTGVASLGGTAAFMGRVNDDELGHSFKDDLTKIGVPFIGSFDDKDPSSGCCLSFVTDDADRTMQTYLGAAANVSPKDVDADVIRESSVLYLEGYLWDAPKAKAAFLKAADIAHEADRMVSITLSDPFCVDRHRESFLDLIKNHIDILFANEHEICSLYQVASFDEALQLARADCNIAALTRSAKGSVVASGDEVHVIDAAAPDALIDTTGAGDLYAAGFLYGLTHGLHLADCGTVASLAAAEVISHTGARPQKNLRQYVAEKGVKLGSAA